MFTGEKETREGNINSNQLTTHISQLLTSKRTFIGLFKIYSLH